MLDLVHRIITSVKFTDLSLRNSVMHTHVFKLFILFIKLVVKKGGTQTQNWLQIGQKLGIKITHFVCAFSFSEQESLEKNPEKIHTL